jgi:hypothetical protein
MLLSVAFGVFLSAVWDQLKKKAACFPAAKNSWKDESLPAIFRVPNPKFFFFWIRIQYCRRN